MNNLMKLIKKTSMLTLFALLPILMLLASCGSTDGTTPDGETVSEGDVWKNHELVGGKTKLIEGVKGVEALNVSAGAGAARDRAIQDACQKAVQEVTGLIIKSKKLVRNHELVESKITAKTMGYVQSYKVINEGQADGVYYVTLDVIVGIDKIEENTDAIIANNDLMNYPRLVVLVNEEGKREDGSTFETSSFGTKLEQYMSEKGFPFVDKNIVQEVMAKEQIRMSDVAGSTVPKDLSAALAGHGAEILIIGDVHSSFFMSPYGAIKSYRSTASVKVVNASDGSIIASVVDNPLQGHPGGTDEDAAAGAMIKNIIREGEDGMEGVGPSLVKAIADKWAQILRDGTEYQLLIVGLDFGGYTKFKNALTTSFRDAKKIFPKGFQGDQSKIMVRWNGTSQSLAEALYVRGDSMGFTIDVKNIDGNIITITAVAK